MANIPVLKTLHVHGCMVAIEHSHSCLDIEGLKLVVETVLELDSDKLVSLTGGRIKK